MSFFKEIVFHSRFCPGCGKSFGKIRWLCLDCELLFINKINPQSRKLSEKITHYYLVDWYPGDLQLTRLIHSLKGGGLFETYTMFAQLMLAYFPKIKGRTLFYPTKGSKDHAYQLANIISKLDGLEKQALLKTKKEKQALLNRFERKKLKFVSSLWRGRSAYLVDDIVTSGATVKACYEALNQPSEMTVWSLFYRKDL